MASSDSEDSIRQVCLGNQDVLIARLQHRRLSPHDPIAYHDLFAELVRYLRELRAGGRSFPDVWEELRCRAKARRLKDESWKVVENAFTPTDPRRNRISPAERSDADLTP